MQKQTQRTDSPSESLAELLDNRFVIPGTRIRFGIDSVIGLLPGLGDWMTGVISIYFLAYAAWAGGKPAVLVRMFLNIMIDILIGSIPLLGDLFDVAWKANLKNARLLTEVRQHSEQVEKESRWLLWSLLVLFVAVILGVLVLMGWIVAQLLDLVF